MKTGPNIIDWTHRTNPNNFDNRQRFLILHHTVTHSAEDTINVLNERGLSIHYIVEKDGTIYRAVDDGKRTWHAGVSQWGSGNGLRNNINDPSIGVEIVNMGDEAFPEVQMQAVVDLSWMLMDEYGIKPEGILAHAEIAPGRKDDPSGYFDWKFYHTKLGLFPGLYDSQLSPKEQKEVIFRPGSQEEDEIRTLQEALSKHGYKISTLGVYNPETEEVDRSFTGKYDKDTKNAVEAFNRRFCPEVFFKEKVDNEGNVIHNPLNTQWYRLSAERLRFLLKPQSKPTPVVTDQSTVATASPPPAVVFSKTALKQQRLSPPTSPDPAKEEEAPDDKKRKTTTPTMRR